jgi:hypothetical protein
VDHIIVLGEAHLRRILKSYARYYNETRTHLALEGCARFSPGSANRCGQAIDLTGGPGSSHMKLLFLRDFLVLSRC